MGVELICDEDPLLIGCRGNGLCNMSHKVRRRARRANARCNLFAGGHFEIGRQALRARANVFLFLPFALAGLACHTGLHRICSAVNVGGVPLRGRSIKPVRTKSRKSSLLISEASALVSFGVNSRPRPRQ